MRVKLKDVGEIVTGNTPSMKNPEYYGSDDIGFIKPDVITDEGISDLYTSKDFISEAARSKARIVSDSAILVTCIGSIGKVGIVRKEEFAFNQQINAIIPKNEVNTEYLAYNILFNRKRLVDIANAPVVPIINKTQFGEFDIYYDEDIKNQEKIACLLNMVWEILQRRKKQLNLFDSLIKARFVEMFGDMHSYTDKVTLEELSEFVTVGIANAATHAYTDSGVVMFRNLNIKENYLDDEDLIYITEEFASKYKNKTLKENDILVTRTGYPGIACIVPRKYEGAQTFTTLIVRLKDTQLTTPVYISHYINSDYGKEFIEGGKVGVAQQNFGAKSLAKLPVHVPLIEEQEKFSDFVAQVAKSKVAVQKALDETQQLFNSLMQQYFG